MAPLAKTEPSTLMTWHDVWMRSKLQRPSPHQPIHQREASDPPRVHLRERQRSSLLQLREDALDEVMREIDTILDRAAEEDGRDLTEDEVARLEELRESRQSLSAQIESMVQDREVAAEAASSRRRSQVQQGDNPGGGVGLGAPVQVRSEPGPYGDGAAGLRRLLLDMGVSRGLHATSDTEFRLASIEERQRQHIESAMSSDASPYTRAVATSDLGGVLTPQVTMASQTHDRATSMSDLVGIVNPQYDPSRVRRGVYPRGVTLQLAQRYPIWAEGDSLTLPRVTTKPAAGVQTEGAAHTDTKIVTAGVKADLVTVSAKAAISLQAVERGVISMELLSDQMGRAWTQEANNLVLNGQGTAATPDEPLGLLQKRVAQAIEKDDASPSAVKAVDYLTAAKTAVSKANLMRPDCFVVSPDFIGHLEEAKGSDGQYVVPPYPAWVQNMGGAGTAPMVEGLTAELEWRRVPIYSDSQISDTWKDDETGNGTGGNQTRLLAITSMDMPIFWNGPQTMIYEQTLAESGQILLVVRGYLAFNPLYAPESWRYVRGTGLNL